jgi:hemolysin activation/secretion protein
MMKTGIALKLTAVTACFVLLSTIAQAATPTDAGRLLRESTPQAITPVPKKPVIEVPAESTEKPLPPGIKFMVSGFIYSGNTVFSTLELDSIMAPVVGKQVTLVELEKAVEQITRAYLSRGYFLATAIIPPQTIKSGQPIKLQILEGRLEKIDLKTSPPETRVPRSLLVQYGNRIEAGKPVEEAKLTATAMLVNELPALRTRVVLEPGKETGTTKATLEVTEDKPFSVSLTGDNYGSYSTGYYRVGTALDLYSPFRLGDQLTLRGLTSTSGDTQNAGANWSVPLSAAGTRLSLDYAWVRYELGRSFKALEAGGDAHGFNLLIMQPLVRRSNMLVNFQFGGEGKLLDDRVNSAGSINRRHLVNIQAGLNLSAEDGFFGGGFTTFNVTCSSGSKIFHDDAAKVADQSAAGRQTEGGYNKIVGGISRTQAIYGDLSLFAGINGQWSDKNLDSSEQFSIGGPFGVRAYPVGEASADQGMVTTAELRYLLPKVEILPGRVQLAGLFDHGYAQLESRPQAGSSTNVRHLYGAGFGVNWQWERYLSLRTSVSWLMGELPTSDNTGGDKPTVYFQAMVRY